MVPHFHSVRVALRAQCVRRNESANVRQSLLSFFFFFCATTFIRKLGPGARGVTILLLASCWRLKKYNRTGWRTNKIFEMRVNENDTHVLWN